jgi:hypothetical protein
MNKHNFGEGFQFFEWLALDFVLDKESNIFIEEFVQNPFRNEFHPSVLDQILEIIAL